MKIEKKEVANWLKKAKKVICESQSIEDKFSSGCYLSRACLAKHVDEKIQELVEVYDQGSFPDSLVIDAPSNMGISLPTQDLVGRTAIKEEIWAHLIGDSVQKIAVCGMGGIGKTTIIKHIHNQLLKETKFDKVIWVTVSEQFNVFKLQKDIASIFKEDLSKFEDTNIRAGMIAQMLGKIKRYVLILDDVWNQFSLDDVGIPEPTVSNGCKLVLTSRSMEVGQSMGCEVIKVEPLPGEVALNLFLDKIGREVLQVPTLELVLKLVVEQCGGLPLAIVTIASSMKGERNVDIWMDALDQIKGHVYNIDGISNEVIERLKFSYNRLGDPKIKQCFLYCALYPEDFDIEREELIECWIDEGLIDERETRQAMYYRGHAILNRLENNCLLESAEDGTCVKMHDLVRSMALQIASASPRYLVKSGMQLEELPEQEWPEDLEKVSLMQNDISEISSNMTLPNCRTLSTLLLQNNYSLTMIHESFFTLLIGLKILDLSSTSIKYLPDSVSDLANLTALILRWCENLAYVPSLAKLRALKKLDLRYSGIRAVPDGIELLLQLKYLDLTSIFLKEIPCGILPKLSRLQVFKAERSYVKMEEVLGLMKLENMAFKLYNLQDYNKYVSSSLQLLKRPRQYSLFVVGDETYEIDDDIEFLENLVEDLSTTRIIYFNKYSICGDSIVLPANIEVLGMCECDDVRSLGDISSIKDATELKICYIKACYQIEMLLSLSSCHNILRSIEYLSLQDLDNLKVVFTGDISDTYLSTSPGTFSRLKNFHICGCEKLEKLFSLKVLQLLQNLEVFAVYNCSQIVEIAAASDGEEENKEAGKDSITIILPKLKFFRLYNLPELKCIYNNHSAMICNSLEEVDVIDCPKLKRIPLLLPPLGDRQPFPPPSLKRIYVSPEACWESLEWDDPNTKNVLQPFYSSMDSECWRICYHEVACKCGINFLEGTPRQVEKTEMALIFAADLTGLDVLGSNHSYICVTFFDVI